MKKGNILILTYISIVVALVASVKMAHTLASHGTTPPPALIADCGDAPITTSPGE